MSEMADQWLEEGKAEGKAEGKIEGIAEGEIKGTIKTLLKLNKTEAEICEYMREEFEFSYEQTLQRISIIRDF